MDRKRERDNIEEGIVKKKKVRHTFKKFEVKNEKVWEFIKDDEEFEEFNVWGEENEENCRRIRWYINGKKEMQAMKGKGTKESYWIKSWHPNGELASEEKMESSEHGMQMA